MDYGTVVTYLICIMALCIFGKIFMMPLVKIIHLIINSLLGALIIYIINIIGSVFAFHIGLNYITAVIIGLLGIPGAILLIILKIFL
ncbi:MAG: pro-sigmaK processing inhibitor BofA family protein [Clostridia bacterium]|nr:pro-sigmaK processing inhibitor BofA family protein [Clostridia bacterium]